MNCAWFPGHQDGRKGRRGANLSGMGIAQAGIAFRISESVTDMEAYMSAVFGEAATEIALPVSVRFDIRNHSDVMLQSFGEVCFISNDDLAWPLIQDDTFDATRLHAALGAPDLLMAFCHYDSGGSHGYALFENGRRTRTRLQTRGLPDAPTLRESGRPRPFERRWLRGRHDVVAEAALSEAAHRTNLRGEREGAVSAHELTGRMLQDGLEALFGVCPWETLLTPHYRFFRLGPERPAEGEPAISRARSIAASKRPWWQFL